MDAVYAQLAAGLNAGSCTSGRAHGHQAYNWDIHLLHPSGTRTSVLPSCRREYLEDNFARGLPAVKIPVSQICLDSWQQLGILASAVKSLAGNDFHHPCACSGAKLFKACMNRNIYLPWYISSSAVLAPRLCARACVHMQLLRKSASQTANKAHDNRMFSFVMCTVQRCSHCCQYSVAPEQCTRQADPSEKLSLHLNLCRSLMVPSKLYRASSTCKACRSTWKALLTSAFLQQFN